MRLYSLNSLLGISDAVLLSFIVLVLVIFTIVAVVAVVPIGVWFRCLVSGAYVGMIRLVGMKMRGVDVKLVIDSYIEAKKAGLEITVGSLETHYLAGGRVKKVVEALISSHSARISLTEGQAKGIDLAGRDVVRAVKESVKPKVIETPEISAVAQNGVELKVKAKVTVRTKLDRLIGGAGEETIKSRVGEGIVTTVGSAKDHYDVLQNPDSISKVIQEQGLDDGTAYQIVSVNIKDIDVGENIGAKLRSREAATKKETEQAKAEAQRAAAIAKEQVMRARSESMRARLLEAESSVPKALAEAFKKGKIGVMDYYRMQNIISDTTMRNSIGGNQDPRIATKKTGSDNN
ncbi:MAG: flotillin-like protein FloA [Candidatus Woesearchaeota archaeon]